MGRSCRAHSSYETSSESHAARLQDERFVRDFLQKSRAKSQKRAFRTRLPPKVTRQVSKTSLSYETSSKSHMSSPQNERFPQKLTCQSLQNERFARDFLQKVQRKHPSEHTHHAALPSSFLLWDVGHSCRTLLWDTLVGHTLRTRLPPKVTLRGCKTSVSYEIPLKNERFVRDFLQKSHVKSPKRAFRTRLPPKVTCQVPKTSVLYETSSKTHMSKSAKRTFRARLPPKVQRKHPSEHTHHAALPSSFAIPAPPNDTRSHANPNVTATFTSTTTHNLPIPCACHESFRVHMSNAHKGTASATKCHLRHTSQPHDSLRLPRKSHFHTSKPAQSPAPATKSSNVISCELQQNLHHTTRLE